MKGKGLKCKGGAWWVTPGNYSRPSLCPSSFLRYLYNTEVDDDPTEAVLYILVNNETRIILMGSKLNLVEVVVVYLVVFVISNMFVAVVIVVDFHIGFSYGQ